MPHARIVASTLRSAERAIRAFTCVLTGKDLPIPLRHPAGHARTSTRSAPTTCASSAIRWPPWSATDEQTGVGSARSDRGRLRAAAHDLSIRRRRFDNPEPRIHDYGDYGNVHKAAGVRVRRRRRGASRRRPTTSSRTCSSTRATPTCRSSSTPRSRSSTDDGKLTLWSSTQTPHYVHRALAKVLELPASRIRVDRDCPTAAASAASAIRSTTRSSAAKTALMLGRPVKIAPHPRGGLLLPPRPPPGADADAHRRRPKDGTHHRACTCRRCSTAAPTAATASPRTYYTGALQTVTYELPRYQFDGARVFTNKPPCGPKRGHGTPQPRFGLRGPARQDRRASSASTRPSCASACSPSPTRSPPTG